MGFVIGGQRYRGRAVCALSLVVFACTPGITNIQPTMGTPAYVSSGRFPRTPIQISGVQICDPATKVDLGSDTTSNAVDACSANGAQATAHVDRLSTDGAISLARGTTLPASAMTSSQLFSVRTMRNQNGFSFANAGGIPQEGFGDYVDLFGVDQLMVQVDVCAPFGSHCPVPTGVPDPVAFAFVGVTMAILNGKGECFGFAMGSQRLMWGDVPIATFDPAASTVWTMSSTATGLQHFLKIQHIAQLSGEWLRAYVLNSAINGSDSAAFQNTRNRITAALSASPPDFPIIAIRRGNEGHVMVAYDVESGTSTNGGVGNGDYFIYVYDPNQPFSTSENTNFASHQLLEQTQGRIHVMASNSWSFPGLTFGSPASPWTGGMDSLVPLSRNTVPLNHPTMPALTDLVGSLVFASGAADTVQITDGNGNRLLNADGTVDHTAGRSIPNAAIVPALGDGAAAGTPLFAFVDPGVYRHELRVRGAGPYQDGSITKDFSTLVGSESQTDQSANDQLTFDGPGRALRFSSGAAHKPVAVQLATHADGGAARVVLLQTTSFKDAADTVSFAPGSGSVRFDHAVGGGSAPLRFTLGVVQRGGAVAAFTSPELRVAPGDALTITPADWSRLDSTTVELVIRHAGGATETRTLKQASPVALSAGPSADGRLTLTINAAPLGLQPLAAVEAACAGDALRWVGIAKFDGAAGPKSLQADFSLTSRGCSNAHGSKPIVLVRALDAQGQPSMVAPLVVNVP